MSDPFDAYIPSLLSKEGMGVLTNNPADHGGPTIWGITEVRARAAGYQGPMGGLTRDQAVAIYRLYYWTEPRFDQIAPILPPLATLLLDLGVNNGPVTAGKFLQRGLNVLSLDGGPDLVVDGVLGPMTRALLVSYRTRRAAQGGDVLILNLVRALSAGRYVELAEADRSQRTFVFGWLSNRAFA